MKAKELRAKTKKELQKLLSENRDRLRQLRFELSQGKVKNVREIRRVKRDIARMLTIINEKEKQKESK